MIREIKTLEELEKLSRLPMPCWEGRALEGLEDELMGIDPEVKIAYCTGKTYNEAYGITGATAFPDDLIIVYLENFSLPVMVWRMQYGCGWSNQLRINH